MKVTKSTRKKNASPELTVQKISASPGLPQAPITAPFLEKLKVWALGAVLLLVGSLVVDHFNGGGVGCWPPKKIRVHQNAHIKLNLQKSGPYYIDGLCCSAGGKVMILDHASHRILSFDLSGNYLGDSTMAECGDFSTNQAIDPKTNRHFTVERDMQRILVTDASGKILSYIALKDKPVSLALDRQERLYVGYDDHNFIQVFSAASGNFLGELEVDNPDADLTYLDAAFIRATDDGWLITADRYSVWIYRLPPA